MAASEAKQILADAIENAPRMQGEHPASWLTCRIRLALDALDTPEAWNFWEPPNNTDAWVFMAHGFIRRAWFSFGSWRNSDASPIRGVVAWTACFIPPPPTEAEIEAATHKG